MSDRVEDACTPPEGHPCADRVVLAVKGLSDDAVNLRKDFERRFVLRRCSLHDVDGSA